MKFNKNRGIRWTVMAASTLFFLAFSGFVSVHAVCPIGGFELFFTGIFRTGFSLAGLFSGMVALFLIMSVLSVIFRRAYCGYICPLGALQELAELAGKKILPGKMTRPFIKGRADRVLRWIKYAVLASFVVLAGLVGGHWMIKGDPFIVLINLFGSGNILEKLARNLSSSLFLAGILVFAFFQGRGFCKYACPAGAWFGLLSKISPEKIIRKGDKCIGCGLCSKACPMNIEVATLDRVTTAECLGCKECLAACPVDGALASVTAGAEIHRLVAPVAAAAVFSGGVYLSASTLSQGSGGEYHGGGDPAYHSLETSLESGQALSQGGCASCVGCGLCQV